MAREDGKGGGERGGGEICCRVHGRYTYTCIQLRILVNYMYKYIYIYTIMYMDELHNSIMHNYVPPQPRCIYYGRGGN